MRTKLGALLGAVGTLLLATSVTMAAPGGTSGKPSDHPGGGPPASHGGGGQPSNPGGGGGGGGGQPTDNPGGGNGGGGGGKPTDNPGGGGGGGGGNGQPTDNPGGGGGGGSPTYTIDVWKTANPESVPASGGTVEFTVHVKATGTGFFQVFGVDDPLAGCTLGSAVEEDGDGDDKLETDEIWAWSCTVDNVTPGTENTATVHACHNGSACNHEAHDAEAEGSVTVEEDDAEGTPVVTPNPSQDEAGITECPCDTIGDPVGTAGGPRSLLLVVSLGMLLASLILVTPARPVRARNANQ